MKTSIEKILDESNCNNVMLYDGNEKLTEFEQVAVIPIDEIIYVILKPVTKIAGVNDDEVLLFEIKDDDTGGYLEVVSDEEIIETAFDEYSKLLKAEETI